MDVIKGAEFKQTPDGTVLMNLSYLDGKEKAAIVSPEAIPDLLGLLMSVVLNSKDPKVKYWDRLLSIHQLSFLAHKDGVELLYELRGMDGEVLTAPVPAEALERLFSELGKK